MGKSGLNLVHSNDRETVFREFKRGFELGECFVEARLKSKEGDYIWTETNGRAFTEKEGNLKVLLHVRDVNERKRIEKSIEESEIKYRYILNNIREGYYEVDLKGNFSLCNKRVCEFLGYTSDQLIGMNFRNIMVKENQELVYKKFNSVYKSEYPQDIVELEIFGKDGKRSFVESSVSLKLNSKGEKIGFFGLARDITEKKETEQKLKESEIKYRHLFESSPFTIGLLDLKGNILDLNTPTNQFLTTRTKDDLIGKNIREIFSLHEKEKPILPIMKEHIRRMLKGEITEPFEVPFYRADGSIQWVKVQGSLIKIEGKNLIQLIVRDITEEKKAEQKLKESEEKFRLAFENAADAIFWAAPNSGLIINCNKAAEILLEKRKEEIIGQHQTTIHPPQEAIYYAEMFQRHIKQKGVVNDEATLITKSGKIIPVHITATVTLISGVPIIQGIFRDITERKQAEQKLKESEKKYREIIENTMEGYFEVDLGGNITFFNDALCEMMGFSSEDLMGLNYKSFMTEESIKRTLKVFNDVYNTKVPFKNFQYEIISRNGKKLYGESSVYLRYDSNGNKIGFSGLVRDVTEKVEAEQKLKESEEKFRIISENSNDLITFIDNNSRIEYVSEKPMFKIFGYTSEELMGQNIINFIHPDDVNKLLNILKENIKTTKRIAELRIKHKDGHYIWTESNGSLFIDKDSNQKFLGITRDITERKKAEKILKEDREKFRRIFETIPDIFFLISNDGIFLDYMGKEKDLYAPPEGFLGKSIKKVLPKKLADRTFNAIQKTLKRKQPIIIEYDLPVRGKTHYYEARFLLFSKTQVATFIRDITERKKAEFLIKEEIEKLKELDQIRKDLISRVSHELKTPLMPVCIGSELLLSAYKDQIGKVALEIIEMIDKGGKRLSMLVEKLLDVTKIEYNKLKLEKEKCDLCELIREASNDIKFLVEKRGINLSVVVPDKLFLELDKIRIEQVITNLLSNAVKNTPPKGRVNIVLEAYNNKWAIISVSDTGVGFTEDEIKKLFARFGKIERYGPGLEYIDIKGSGLGLYISKQIVDLHDGKIWCESAGRNMGCIFKVRLPIK